VGNGAVYPSSGQVSRNLRKWISDHGSGVRVTTKLNPAEPPQRPAPGPEPSGRSSQRTGPQDYPLAPPESEKDGLPPQAETSPIGFHIIFI